MSTRDYTGTSRRTRLAASAAVVASLALPAGLVAQSGPRAASPLWGDLVPGPYRIGYKVEKLRDATRSATPRDRGYPLVLRYWLTRREP